MLAPPQRTFSPSWSDALAAEKLVAEGDLLREDADAMVAKARTRAWPPRFE